MSGRRILLYIEACAICGLILVGYVSTFRSIWDLVF